MHLHVGTECFHSRISHGSLDRCVCVGLCRVYASLQHTAVNDHVSTQISTKHCFLLVYARITQLHQSCRFIPCGYLHNRQIDSAVAHQVSVIRWKNTVRFANIGLCSAPGGTKEKPDLAMKYEEDLGDKFSPSNQKCGAPSPRSQDHLQQQTRYLGA
ncbi:hypothetical protein BDU57DRAFT_299699 [Ampelomyces quisqualis]|uniref:Uncharacterized protein n=1 Tax=Ampelomyces quisqualis TaxID=50730 RepID=A0A6A5QIW1_AMPQU|nr:hypothetical protein BDU57DRAFT_299699 [Ampelomyces quisqualis]